jgi:hypothetical protein
VAQVIATKAMPMPRLSRSSVVRASLAGAIARCVAPVHAELGDELHPRRAGERSAVLVGRYAGSRRGLESSQETPVASLASCGARAGEERA